MFQKQNSNKKILKLWNSKKKLTLLKTEPSIICSHLKFMIIVCLFVCSLEYSTLTVIQRKEMDRI